MARKPNDRATRVEVIAIHDRLKEVIIPLVDGICRYPEGMDDQIVADELKVSKTSVSGLRNEMFGRLNTARTSGGDEVKRVTENLVTCYETLKDRHNKLVMLLALNKVVDCRHLEVK